MHADSDLSAYIDGELAPAERAGVDAHLAGCERCRARLEELRATASLIQRLQAPRPSRSLVPVVAERYNWLRPLRSFSTVATGAFLMVFLVTAVGRSGSGLGGGPEVPFGRTTAAAPAATAAPETAGLATARSIPAPFAAPAAQATAAADTALRQVSPPSPAPSAESPKAIAQGEARYSRREPSPVADPLMWLGLAVVAAITAIFAHWRLRTA